MLSHQEKGEGDKEQEKKREIKMQTTESTEKAKAVVVSTLGVFCTQIRHRRGVTVLADGDPRGLFHCLT